MRPLLIPLFVFSEYQPTLSLRVRYLNWISRDHPNTYWWCCATFSLIHRRNASSNFGLLPGETSENRLKAWPLYLVEYLNKRRENSKVCLLLMEVWFCRLSFTCFSESRKHGFATTAEQLFLMRRRQWIPRLFQTFREDIANLPQRSLHLSNGICCQ